MDDPPGPPAGMQLKDTLQLDGRDESFVAVHCSDIRLRSASEYRDYAVDLGEIAATAAVACCRDSSAGLSDMADLEFHQFGLGNPGGPEHCHSGQRAAHHRDLIASI